VEPGRDASAPGELKPALGGAKSGGWSSPALDEIGFGSFEAARSGVPDVGLGGRAGRRGRAAPSRAVAAERFAGALASSSSARETILAVTRASVRYVLDAADLPLPPASRACRMRHRSRSVPRRSSGQPGRSARGQPRRFFASAGGSLVQHTHRAL
jgi:hypothetical protein